MATLELTKYSDEVTEAMRAFIESQKDELGLKDVFYGDPPLKPAYPCVGVVSGPKDRGIANLQHWRITFRVTVIVYFLDMAESTDFNQRELERLAEKIEDVVMSNRTLDGLVTDHGFVTRMEPGVFVRQRTRIKACRLHWQAESRQFML